MFSDSGSKLKSIAGILFVLNLIGFVVLAFVFGWQDVVHTGYNRYYTEREFQPVIFFSLLVAGPIFSYVECLALYALGEIADDTKENKTRISECEKKVKELNDAFKQFTTNDTATVEKSESDDQSTVSAAPSFFSVNVDAISTSEDSSEVTPVKTDRTDMIICPKCGTAQRSGRNICWQCGVPFNKE